MKINIYLHFDGNCEEALNFYVKELGAKPVMVLRYGESPMAKETAKELHNKILHARITIDDNVIMMSDAPPGRFKAQEGFSVSIGIDKAAEAERLFKALSEKAEICMPIGETFWAERFGMLVDQFGIPWMINCEKKS